MNLRLTWAEFKALYALKAPIALQYKETANAFEVWLTDEQDSYWTPVFKSEDAQYDATTYTEFTTGYQPLCNKAKTPRTSDLRERLATEKPSGSRATQVTFDWSDKTTWYPDSARVVGETPSEPVGETYYALAHASVIDLYHGKVFGEDNLKDASNNSYRVSLTLDGVAKSEVDPHTDTGDYEVDYKNGRILPRTFARGDGAVLVTYYYAQTSKFWVKPATGCKLVINEVECQFSNDIELLDTAVFQPRGLASEFASQLGLPAGTKIPLGAPLKYKSMRDFYGDCMRAYPVYPPLGGSGWRGLNVPSTVLVWDYTRTTDLYASKGMDIEVKLEHDCAYGGSFATVTFYCDSVPE